jgi:hypothetical protein
MLENYYAARRLNPQARRLRYARIRSRVAWALAKSSADKISFIAV